MLQKFKFSKNDVYGVGDNYWAFVKKTAKGYEALASFQSCKDYMHEGIANVVHKKQITTSSSYSHTSGICLDNLLFALSFRFKPGLKKRVYSTKLMLNMLEKQNGVAATKVLEVNITSASKEHKMYVFQADKIYLESPSLMHGMVAFLRTMHLFKDVKYTTLSNVKKTLEKQGIKDSEVLQFMVKYDILDVLMENHSSIFKNLTLKDVYPEKITNKNCNSYHGGFGMVSLVCNRLCCKVYSDRVNKVLKDNNIPFMNG